MLLYQILEGLPPPSLFAAQGGGLAQNGLREVLARIGEPTFPSPLPKR